MNAYAPVSMPAVGLTLAAGNIQQVRRQDILFHEKRYNAFEYFQLSGISHRYNIDPDNGQVTTGIYAHETVITPHFIRTPGGQGLFSMQALTDCTFLQVPAGTFRDLSEQNQEIRLFGRAVVEKDYTRHLAFEVLFRSGQARDRLLYFRQHYPALENLIPHTVIASFLGITPVSFSRLRNELAKK